MRKRELKFALREASRICREDQFIIIGSQAVHAYCARPPAEVTLSQECDLYPRNRIEAANMLAGELGRRSPFARRYGFHVDVVAPELATLPQGWELRLQRLDAGPVTAFCLEAHDLAVSKLAAGRLKDYEFVAALFRTGLAKPRRVSLRITKLESPNEQARVRARLKSVLEGM